MATIGFFDVLLHRPSRSGAICCSRGVGAALVIKGDGESFDGKPAVNASALVDEDHPELGRRGERLSRDPPILPGK